MDDLIIEFITETNESLEELDLDLVNLEKNPNDKDLLGKIFRLMHTIKGTCGFLSLPRLEKVAHHAENVLGKFRDGALEVTPGYVTLIFESIDQIKYIVSEIEETGSEPAGSDKALIDRLDAAYEGKEVSGDASAVGESSPEDPEDEKDIVIDIQEKELAPGDASIDELEAAFAAAPGMEGIVNPADEQKEEGKSEEEGKSAAPPPPPPIKKEEPKNKTAKKEKKVASQTLRVSVDVLEDLMTMVSELVLTRNQLLQIVRSHDNTEFSAPLQNLNHVVSELQEGVMKTRMQPIGNAWSKLPRIIRDLGLELNKKIELVMSGQETELDRQVLELIKDPLTHMVRNSGDHGIEMPEERVKLGKPETGKIWLDAYHEGGHIIIKITDDGKGLSEDKIKEKILSNGLATEEELEEMSSQQIQQFIFAAGFSTAEKVTAVSGRGVGMDVVRTNIEKIGGTIDLKSKAGEGSTFTIKIPLTLAIVSALIVEAAGERFAIPQLSIKELVMVTEKTDNRIEYIKGSPVFRLRDSLLPLVSLSNILGLSENNALDEVKELTCNDDKKPSTEENIKATEQVLHDDNEAITSEEVTNSASENAEIIDDDEKENSKLAEDAKRKNLYLVISQVGGYEFGIIVDRVFDTEEIVVKPVAQMLKDLTLFSGNTILGDGSVIMILDPNGIANATGNIAVGDAHDNHDEEVFSHTNKKKTSLLLFNVGEPAPKAVPLSLVARLENIKAKDVEYASGKMTVQYRGTLMPLIPFCPSVQMGDSDDDEKPVLVFADKDQSMGIIVNEIVDIIEEYIDIQLSSSQGNLLGSAIINGVSTDVVDIAYFLNSVNKDWFKDHDDTPFAKHDDDLELRKRVLIVDDSPFFRNMLTPLLSVAGYDVTTLEGPQDALELRDKGVVFDAIISDIEMPDINGFEFAQHVKQENSKWADIPMIALSSHATPEDIEHGTQVGFNSYVAKFDKDTLLNTLAQTLNS